MKNSRGSNLPRVSCIVCNSQSTKFIISKNGSYDAGESISLYRCNACKLVFSAFAEKKFIPSMYDYYTGRIGIDKNHLYDSITELRYKELLSVLRGMVCGNRILDVGCGQGHFVDVAMREGWDVLGIDLSGPAIDICKSLNLQVKKIDIFSKDLSACSFDLVTMFEFIEHVSSPRIFIRRAEELLKPGGILYLTTPNFASLGRRLLGKKWDIIHSEHRVYFTPNTLRSLIHRYTTFNVVSIFTRNLSINILRHFFTEKRNKTRENCNNCYISREQKIRKKIEHFGILRLSKRIINAVLNWFGLGESIVIFCRKITK